MSLKIIANVDDPPIGALITVDLISSSNKAKIEISYPKIWKISENIQLFVGNELICETSQDVARFLALKYDETLYGGQNILERTEIDSWISLCLGQLKNEEKIENALEHLENSLTMRTYLVGGKLSLADIFIYSTLSLNDILTFKNQQLPNTNRWYKLIQSLPSIKKISKMGKSTKSKEKEVKKTSTNIRKQEGKFVDLPNAEMGKVVVRFPPEASGYLHIGHAKAALLNQHYAELFNGTLIMRFDDTNPAKENVEYEKAILKDLELLEIKPDRFTHSSDYFDIMLNYCEELIKNNKAFVDNTPAQIMKDEREQRIPSKNRNNSVELNLKLWNEMIKGTRIGQENCVRAKIDYESVNGCMRDPTIYRCKPESHPRTGKKYNVYPTYDFACPIVDSIEGVTHTLRTTEYHDRDDQFYWFIEALKLRRPYIYEYSRLNMTNTVLSKRKLTWFVEEKIVDGWDDPRFPTVRGILRRGMTVNGLKQFIIAQGSSRSVVFMEWDKIWSFNKKVIDPIAIRYTGLNINELVSVIVDGEITGNVKNLIVQNHPKDPKIGTKNVKISRHLLIERCDAELLNEGQNATFVNWGNLMVDKIERNNGVINKIKVRLNLDNKDFKNTLKLTWLAANDDDDANTIEKVTSNLIPCVAVYFEHIITKPVLGKDDDFKDFVAKNTRKEVMLVGEKELERVKEGEIIQLQRKGFFRCDVPYAPLSDFTSRVRPLILFHIPDGHVTTPPISASSNLTKDNKKTSKSSSNANVEELIKKIETQGNKVRELKTSKADKKTIDFEVKQLLNFKAEYKTIIGSDWKPGVIASSPAETSVNELSSNSLIELVDKKIQDQANKVRNLKETIAVEVKDLLALKEEFKKISGNDWQPDAVASILPVKFNGKSPDDIELINKQIEEQGNKVRKLKSDKVDKKIIDAEIKWLLELKENYKKASGEDWKPLANVKPITMSKDTAETLDKKISDQGDKVRKLKLDKSDKKLIDDEVKILLNLKNQYKILTSNEWKPPVSLSNANKKQKSNEKSQKKIKSKESQSSKELDSVKTGTRLCIEVKKNENLSEWYSQVIVKGEMIDYYDVSGCYILRPWSYSIWEIIQNFINCEIKKLGVQNCYFPIFVSKTVLEREKDHIADFAPEVAWVTKSGNSELAEPIAIRPTSETVMYPSYSKWLKSHRDLPLKLNQWNNVVRWEFKHPQPFLRSREFLWQEGHSAFLTQHEAAEEVMIILELYARVYENILAIPVVRGRKTEKEKFAGGDYTTTVEAFISASGRAIQGATSHHLGQNFSKMFDIQVESADKSGEKIFVYQNSWGLTTRTIGVMIMVHGDDKGLILPPRVASIQAIIVPCGITATTTAEQEKKLMDECNELQKQLSNNGKANLKLDENNSNSNCEFNPLEFNEKEILRVKVDDRNIYSPGWKFNHWELKGVPLRIELGFKDLEKNQVTLVRRDNLERISVDRSGILKSVNKILEEIQRDMFEKANRELNEHIKPCYDWSNFCEELDKKNLLLAPFCGEIDCEDKIKADSSREDAGNEPGAPSMGAKSLCIPFDQPKDTPLTSLKCIHPSCKNSPKFHTLFGRSY
ncbi:hypothetical protein PV325_010958 [Microctonus aethiopoides]|uniref:Bifunctional glutamate/proline--tRNA ligase n=1 Tax=Microctonus aethiopoides TaxID=144406 RepID=A0AA39C8N7_9HYME|nr:hypothetical protein PV325_010958 [Microctonus aethiopoides]KAK0159893.1 hypothetical protein PV328_007357 [Microctonus aethiopoides]